MSASSKKKLRKEQNAAALTEKQLNERKEAKKQKISTLIFVIMMAIVLFVGLTVMVIRGIEGSAFINKHTTALTVGDHKLNSVVMNYYYTDTVNSSYTEWTNMYGDSTAAYLSMLQLDVSKPLDEQTYYADDMTWAEYFMDMAIDRATADYAVYDLAMKANYVLSAEDQLNLESNVNYKDLYSMTSGFDDVDDYMEAFYCPGASRDTYYDYCEVSAIASAFYNDYSDSLTFTDADIRAHEAGNESNYNSYTYASYYLGYNKYIGEDVTDPTTEQIEEASALAKIDATSLLNAASVEALDAAIAALPVNAEATTTATTKNESVIYTSVNSVIRSWVSDPIRKAGDITMIANEVTSTNDDGTETTTINGYYVVMFQEATDNNDLMSNVRHLLVRFDDETDEAKATAKAEAEEHLNTWKQGEATEESFIELVKKYSFDSTASEGGLFENVNPDSSFVPSFLNWSIDPARKVGDVEVIESEYGYHVMYYVGSSELSYRDYMITNELRELALDDWYNTAVDSVTVAEGNLSRIDTGLTLAS